MPAPTEQSLIEDFVATRNERAFEQFVGRHIDMVFGCALRRTGDPELAKDITQNVFTILARKMHRLKAGAGLAGWLHKTTLFETSKALRGESRLKKKMKAFARHSNGGADSAAPESEVIQHVDEAINELSDGDRQLILLHYFEGRSFGEISRTFGKTEGACQRQASRVLSKLEGILRRRGVVASATGLAMIFVAAPAKAAAPAGLVSAISGGAIAGASTLSMSTIITNTIHTMTYAKTKVALLVTVAAAVPIGYQVKLNGELKRELVAYEQRETQYISQTERLTQLEGKIASLPPGVQSLFGPGWAVGKQKPASPMRAGKAQKKGGPEAVEPNREEALAMLKTPLDSVTEMMDNPAMRHLIEEQMKLQIEGTYGALLDHFQLDETSRKGMNKALLDRMLAPASAVQEDDITQILAAKADEDAKIKELLGEEKFDEFERFEDSAGERMELSAFRSALEEKGQELSFEKEQNLMTIMYEENHSASGSSELAAHADELSRGNVPPDAVDSVIDHQRNFQERVRTRAAEFLTPGELVLFAENQKSQLMLLRMGLETMNKEAE